MQTCDTEKELGSFSRIFNNSLPKTKQCNRKSSSKTSRENYKEPIRKPYISSETNFKQYFKNATYYICSKKGHITKYYRVSKKHQKLKLEKEIFQRVYSLLIETSKSEVSSDDQNFQIEELVTTNSDSNISKTNHINILTKEQRLLLNISPHIKILIFKKRI